MELSEGGETMAVIYETKLLGFWRSKMIFPCIYENHSKQVNSSNERGGDVDMDLYHLQMMVNDLTLPSVPTLTIMTSNTFE